MSQATLERGPGGRFASKNGHKTSRRVTVKKDGVASFPSGTGMNSRPAGATGLKRTGGWIFEEFLPDLQGEKGIRIYKEMRENSPIIGAMFFAIEMFCRMCQWFVDPATEDEQGEADAQFLRECMDDMSHTWPDFIDEVMSMMEFGWSWFEILYKKRTDEEDEDGKPASKFSDGKIGWRKFEIRSQESWTEWIFDSEGGIAGMKQMPAPDYEQRSIPIGKSLLFRTTTKKNNPEGRSVLRNAYRPWYFAKRTEEIEGIGIERDMAGLPFAEVPAEMLREDASDADKATLASIIELVKNVRHDEQEGVVWPQSWDADGNKQYEFKLLNSGGTRQFSTDTTITRYEQRMAMVILADFILLGNDSQGSFAMATSKTGLFQSALTAWLDSIQNVINNYAVPRLFRLNGVKGRQLPKMRHDDVQKPSLADLATFVAALAGAGAQLFPDVDLENHFRRLAGLPLREPDDAAKAKEDELRDAKVDAEIKGAKLGLKAQEMGIKGQQAAIDNPLGKQPGSTPGAPTKTTGKVKSKLPPQQRRRTAAVAAAENVRKVRIKKVHHPGYIAESKVINENKDKPQNRSRHRFKAAKWTFPNGHPRCIRCGDEEYEGGMCEPEAA